MGYRIKRLQDTARGVRDAKELAARELGVARPEVSVERVEALERSAGGKLQIVVAGR